MSRVSQSRLVDTRVIYCGDNLDQLRKLPDACIDLIYIDPPFNSNRNYEVFWGETKEKRAFEDRHASTQAYIDFMRPRCVELARVLKKTGSFYYHCDWHASHYVKVMLDQIFGESAFQNEIVWQRVAAKGGQMGRLPANHDTILYYAKNPDEATWNELRVAYDLLNLDGKTLSKYAYTDPDGRRFRLGPLLHPEQGKRPNLDYELMGVRRTWRWSKDRMARAVAAGRVIQSAPGRVPQQKMYLDEQPGRLIGDVWTDINVLNSQAVERLGYPTQKPVALLERIVKISSNENDIVLDAFCGCGTALVAAQNLKRQWIGIDISPTACRVMAKRLRDDCGLQEDERLWKVGRGFIVRDLPWTEDKLRRIPPFEFENWAVIALGGTPNATQTGDMGIDGRIYPVGSLPDTTKDVGKLGFMDVWYPVQVKQKDRVGRPDIDAFEAMMVRAVRTKGFFVSFDYGDGALTEIDRFFRQTGKVIIPLTVREILDEEIARKLA